MEMVFSSQEIENRHDYSKMDSHLLKKGFLSCEC
jgi:hypothetical protein